MSNSPVVPKVKPEDLAARFRPLYKLFLARQGEQLTGSVIDRWAHSAAYLLDCNTDSIRQTLLQYQGRPLTPQFIRQLAYQLSGRSEELVDSYLQLYERPVRSEWVLLELIKTTVCTWRETQVGRELQLLCKTGHPAGHVLYKKVSENWLTYLAYQVGFSRRLEYPYQPDLLLNTSFWGLITPSEDGRDLIFAEWFVTPGIKKANQVILRRRLRFDYPPKEEVDEDGNPTLYACPFLLETDCTDCTKSKEDCCASYREQ